VSRGKKYIYAQNAGTKNKKEMSHYPLSLSARRVANCAIIALACSTPAPAPAIVPEVGEEVTVADTEPAEVRPERPWYPKRSCRRLSFGSSPSETPLLRLGDDDVRGLLGDVSLRTASSPV
jgi:hypothetical protein